MLRLGLKINFIEFITGSSFLYFKKIFNKFESKLSILYPKIKPSSQRIFKKAIANLVFR